MEYGFWQTMKKCFFLIKIFLDFKMSLLDKF